MLKILQLLNIGRQVTPELKHALAAMMKTLEDYAAGTPNTNDDQAVAAISAILTILGLY